MIKSVSLPTQVVVVRVSSREHTRLFKSHSGMKPGLLPAIYFKSFQSFGEKSGEICSVISIKIAVTFFDVN